MKKTTILGILFFGTLWGVSEVFLGEMLYRPGFRYASVPLTIIALGVLSVGRAYFPQIGSSMAIGCCAALYKCVAMLCAIAGTPFFPCHLLAVVLIGLAYDVVFSTLPKRNKAACAVAATYMSYVLFALAITYVFRYRPWVAGGMVKVLRYVGISGSLAAVGSAVFVPACFGLVKVLKQRAGRLSVISWRLAVGGACLTTVALWVVAVTVHV